MKRFYLFLTCALMGVTSLSAKPAVADANGKLPCLFSVSSTQKVQFSQGNLQYNSDNQTWQFAEEQYEYIGNTSGNTNITMDGKNNNTGVADLFGWVGTGASFTGPKYYGLSAVSSPTNYGSSTLGGNWGNLSISNGGKQAYSGWRVLTNSEWIYLISNRAGSNSLRGGATIYDADNKVIAQGLIILPDGWVKPSDCSFSNSMSFTANSYQVDGNWKKMEEAGAVFLPAAGLRNMTSVSSAGNTGYYWSSSYYYNNYVYGLNFYSGNVRDNHSNLFRTNGYSVRLVKYATSAPTASITTPPAAIPDLSYSGSSQTLVTAGTASGGKVMYKLSTEGSYHTYVPSATNAGTYTVQYYVDGSGCFNNSDGASIKVTIEQADYTPSGTYSVSGNSLSYNGSVQALVSVTGSVSDGTIYYKLGDGDWTTEIPSASAMGDYHVWYKVVPSNSNYKDTEPVEVLASITIPTVTDNSDAATINAVLALNPTALKVERTIYADGEYNTICLPFDVSASELTTSTHPLYGYERLKAFKGASVSGSGQDLSIDIFVENVNSIEAGVPYLITYPAGSADIVNPVFTDITVTTTEPGAVSANGVTFQGMFAQVHIDPYTSSARDQDYLFLGANSQLNWPLASETDESVKMRGFRAYFIINRQTIPNNVAPKGTRVRLMDAPKQPTSIENTELNTKVQKLLENGQLIILKNGIKYNAQGQVLK